MTRAAKATVRPAYRVSLRAATEKDFSSLSKLRNDRTIQDSLLAVARPNSPTRVRSWLERRADDDQGAFFIIADAANDRAVGFIQARGIDSLSRIAEMGICIDKAGQGKGLGREAIRLLEKYLLKVFNVRKIWLRVASSNVPATALYRSSGFREVGTLRKHHYANGRFHDVLIMEKLFTKIPLPPR